MIKLVNKTKARRFALDIAKKTGRDGIITIVSKEFYDDLEATVQEAIRKKVHQHPSGLRTLK